MTTTPSVSARPEPAAGPVQLGSTRRGLRVAWLPADGPTVARLTFRVGVADERLPERGLTHLLEHLAHRSLDGVERPAGAHTTALMTTFEARGTAAQVGEHLQGVAAGLAGVGAATAEEVAHEVGALRREAAARPPGTWDALRRARHGLRGWGLLSSSELALDAVDAAALQGWAQAWFTASNAVLVVSGPDAPSWPLALLGEEGPPPAPARVPVPSSLPAQLAAWTRGPAGVVAFTALADDTPATAAAWWWLQQLLRDRLSGGGAPVLGVDVAATGLGRSAGGSAERDLLELAFAVTTTPEQQWAVFRSVQEAAAHGCREPLPPAALERWRSRPAPELTELDRLDASGRAWLLSGADSAPDADALRRQEHEAEAALTPAAVREVLEAALDSALLQVPDGTDEPRGMAALTTVPVAPLRSGSAYFPARGTSGADRLVVSEEGVMSEPADGAPVTVRWDRAVAVLHRGDDVRVVVADTGAEVLVDPLRWDEGADAVAALDAAAPAGLRLDAPVLAAVPAPRSSWTALRPALELVGRWRRVLEDR